MVNKRVDRFHGGVSKASYFSHPPFEVKNGFEMTQIMFF